MRDNPFVDPQERVPLYLSLCVAFGKDEASHRLADVDETCHGLKLSRSQHRDVMSILKGAVDNTHNPRRTREFLKERSDVLPAVKRSLDRLQRWYRCWLREVGLPNHRPPTFDAIEELLNCLNDDPWFSASAVTRGHRGRPGKPWVDDAHRALRAAGVIRKDYRLFLLGQVGATDPYATPK